MSAVIWCGIVAVWAFILIPTWLQRGDRHWRAPLASGAAATTTRVRQRIARSPRISAASDLGDDEQRAPAPARRVAGRPRPAGAHPAPAMAPRRPASLQVRRGRRLVVLLALVLVTAVAAVLEPSRSLVLNLVVDIVTVGYVLHLRNAAIARRREAQRLRRSMASRRRWERSTAEDRSRAIAGWPAAQQPSSVEEAESAGGSIQGDSHVPEQPVYERMRTRRATADAERASTSAAATAPAMIDLTEPGTPLTLDLAAAEAAEHDGSHAAADAANERLAVARAV